jgi:predicted ferric reductase
MSNQDQTRQRGLRSEPGKKSGIAVWIITSILGIIAIAAIGVIIAVARSPLGPAIRPLFNYMFALNTVQTMWYITRASGLVAYILLWFSTAWGLAVSSKIFDQLLHRTFTYDFHQYLSLFAIGFTFLHMIVLLFDGFMPYSIPQILLPFLSAYRPLWIGIGVIALYVMLLVTVTFYMRSRIGMKAFRAIHMASLVGYLGALAHSVFSGSDTSLWSVQLLYAGTFLIVVFLTTYWLIMLAFKKRQVFRGARTPIER